MIAKETINFPVVYDTYGQKIFDADNNMVLDIRGWGWIQKMDSPKLRQDSIGEWVADLMNRDSIVKCAPDEM
jgi:hypothetical protein